MCVVLFSVDNNYCKSEYGCKLQGIVLNNKENLSWASSLKEGDLYYNYRGTNLV